MNDSALGFGSRALQPLAARRLQLLDLTLHKDQALSLALKLGLQLHGQVAAIPEREAAKPQPKGALDRQPTLLDLLPGNPSKQAGKVAGLPESMRKGVLVRQM